MAYALWLACFRRQQIQYRDMSTPLLFRESQPELSIFASDLVFELSPDTRHGRTMSDSDRYKSARFTWGVISSPVRILASYALVASQLATVFHVTYPPLFSSTIHIFKPLVDIWDSLVTIDCVGLGSFEWRFALRVVFQPILYGMLVLLIYCSERCTLRDPQRRKKAMAVLLQRNLLILFFCYPSVIASTVQLFSCVKTSADKEVLSSDDRTSCNDSRHLTFKVVSVLIITLFGLGMPTALALVPRRVSRRLEAEPAEAKAATNLVVQD